MTAELANGLRVICEPIADVRSVALGLWVSVGSRDEPAREAGAAHFLEHLVFKGSERRSAREIAEFADAAGGNLNAYTTREYTCYYDKVLDEQFPEALDVLTDMVCSPRLAEDDFAKERQVILDELRLVEDTPEDLVQDLFFESLWGGHPLGRPVAGRVASICQLTPADLRRFHAQHYVGRRMVLAVAGRIDPDAVLREAARRLGPLPAGDAAGLGNGGAGAGEGPLTARRARAGAGAGAAGAGAGVAGSGAGADGPLVVAGRRPPRARAVRRLRPKRIEQVQLCIGCAAPGLGEAEYWPTLLVANLLGGGTSSRLFQSIREDRGLVYDVGAFHAACTDCGTFAVYLAAGPQAVGEATRLALAEVTRLRVDGVGEQELARQKQQFRRGFWLGLEGTSHRMSRLGRALVLGQSVEDPETVLRHLEGFEVSDLTRAAAALGDPDDWTVAAVGPGAALRSLWPGVGRGAGAKAPAAAPAGDTSAGTGGGGGAGDGGAAVAADAGERIGGQGTAGAAGGAGPGSGGGQGAGSELDGLGGGAEGAA